MRRKLDQHKMAANTAFFDLKKGVAEYLRTSYVDARAKRIAREVGCSPEQAERYLASESCPAWFLAAMAKTHGWDFVRYVFEPLCGPSESAADKLLARVEAHARANQEILRETVREAIAVVHGNVPGGSSGAAEHSEHLDHALGRVADSAQRVKPPAQSKTRQRAAERRRA